MALKPPKYVKTVRQLIYWLYAELILGVVITHLIARLSGNLPGLCKPVK